MVERESPLGAAYAAGMHGQGADGAAGVRLSQPRPGSIVQCAAWPGEERALLEAVTRATGLKLPDGAGAGVTTGERAAFGFAPGRFLLVDEKEGLATTLRQAITDETGTVTDLSHGRTAIRIEGERAEWVFSKFFAIDFALTAFPVGAGRSTVHHDIFAQIQRTGEERFDIYVFRSFARSFWTMLCHGAAEVGYEVV